jgi:hypothetical protein
MSDVEMEPPAEQPNDRTQEEIDDMLQSETEEEGAGAAAGAAAGEEGEGRHPDPATSDLNQGDEVAMLRAAAEAAAAAAAESAASAAAAVAMVAASNVARSSEAASGHQQEGPIVNGKNNSVSEINDRLTRIRVVSTSSNDDNVDDVFNGTSPQAPVAPVQPSETGLPVHYSRIRAARENWQRVTVLNGPPGMNRKWAPAFMGNPCGSFVIPGDTRHLSISNIHNMSERCNMSASFKTGSNDCLGCAVSHKIFDAAKSPICVSLTDHCFPPTVQGSGSGGCIVVIRVEDARLDELPRSLDILLGRGDRRDSLKLPAGSLVMVGSLSHLHVVGVEQYALDLIRAVNELSARVGPSCHVVPAVLVPIAGIHDRELIRKMADLDSWICAAWPQPNLCFAESRGAVWAEMRAAAGGGEGCENSPRNLLLPISYRNTRKVPYTAGEIEQLPGAVRTLTDSAEKNAVTALVTELNRNYFLGLSENISVARGGGLASVGTSAGKIAMIGASHTRRMTDSGAASRVNLMQGLPRWTSDGSCVTNCVEIISQAELTSNDCIYLDLFSNSTFLGTDERGLPSEPEQDEEGGWHIAGTLDVAPARALQRIAKWAAELAVAAGPALVIVALPLSRYVMMPCCNDDQHIDNFDSAGYDGILRGGQEAVKEALERALAGSNQRILYFDPHVVFGDGPLRDLSSSGGDSIWLEDDAVHLTSTAYEDIFTAVVGLWQQPTTVGRRRVASLVQETVQQRRGGADSQPGGRGGPRGGYRGRPGNPGSGRARYTGGGRGGGFQGRRFNPY